MSNKDLAGWFAGLEPSASEVEPAHQHSRQQAAFCCPPEVASDVPDPLALPWCTDARAELSGPLHPPATVGGPLPLLCRACRALKSGQCRATGINATPDAELAARCRNFQPRAGVTFGRVWLWRVELTAGRLLWWTCLPEVGQRQAIERVRADYGHEVLSVMPLPGFTTFPSMINKGDHHE
jgi:hypothetical protein